VTAETFRLLLPETLLIVAAVWIYIAGAFSTPRTNWVWFALASLAIAGYALYRQATDNHVPDFSGPLVLDHFGMFARGLTLVVAALMLLVVAHASRTDDVGAETIGSLLLVMAGVMLVCVAADLVLLFVALELISIPTYVLLYLGRRDIRSQEAAVKYFFLSVLSSALLLYGFSFLYGVGGSTSLVDIRAALAGAAEGASRAEDVVRWIPLARVGLVLAIGGLAFKIAAVPFQFYAPDVYEGTTNANAGLLAVVPKIAGIVALARLLVAGLPGLEGFAWQMLLVMSMITMTLGNCLALWQKNLRRMLAYSSIANAGYMLIGLAVALAILDADKNHEAVPSFDGTGGALLYLTIYAVGTVGAFSVLVHLSGTGQDEVERLDQVAGLARTRPLPAAAMAVFMFSLAGIPPLAGFWGKLVLFSGALTMEMTHGFIPPDVAWWFVVLAIVAALNAAIAAGYYLRVIAAMYFQTSERPATAHGGYGSLTAMLVAAVLVIGIGLAPGYLVGPTDHFGNELRQSLVPRNERWHRKVAEVDQPGAPVEQLVQSKP